MAENENEKRIAKSVTATSQKKKAALATARADSSALTTERADVPSAKNKKPAKKKWVKKKKVDSLKNGVEETEVTVRERKSKFDFTFFTIVMIMLVFGIVTMFSASYAVAYRLKGDSFYYVSRQMLFAGLGVVAMIILSHIDYHFWKNKRILILMAVAAVGLLLMVKIGLGVTQGNAERWIKLGPITIQPSEVLKFVVIVFCAYFAEKNYANRKKLKCGFLPFATIMIVGCGLVIIQPHLSATIIVFILVVAMMFVAGIPVKHMAIMGIAIVVLGAIGITVLVAKDYTYFYSRFQSFLDPESDVTGATFQTYQSLVTIGSGGMFGLGLGNSRQKYLYMPASQNDFVFSIICEELGFVGAMVVIILFIALVARGFFIAGRSRDKFGMMLAVGITLQIGLQALLNIAVVTNSMPNTGISLPFFSYGGSALMMQLGEMGVVLNISRKAELG